MNVGTAKSIHDIVGQWHYNDSRVHNGFVSREELDNILRNERADIRNLINIFTPEALEREVKLARALHNWGLEFTTHRRNGESHYGAASADLIAVLMEINHADH